MTIKNRYAKRAKISEAKVRILIRYFVYGLEAKTIASLSGLNRNTVNRYLTLIRKRIAEFCEQQSPVQGEIEMGPINSLTAKVILTALNRFGPLLKVG